MLLSYRNIMLVCLILSATAIGVAQYFEHVLNYQPCALCYEERIPYYVLIFVSILALVTNKFIGKPLILAIGVLMFFLMLYGAYHAGIEWQFWAGPTSCTGGGSEVSGADLLALLNDIKVVPCDFANWRLFGVSFAGYNALVSALIVSLCAYIGFKKQL